MRRQRTTSTAFLVLVMLAVVDACGYGCLAPIVPQIARREGVGAAVAGVIVMMFGLGQIAGYPVGGRLAWRHGTRRSFLAGLALGAAGSVAFIVQAGLAILLCARFVQGIGAGIVWITIVLDVRQRWPEDAYGRMGGVLGAYAAGGILAPLIGGAGGTTRPFWLLLAVTAIAAAAVIAVSRSGAMVGQVEAAAAGPATRPFVLAAVGIVLAAVGVGTLDGPLPVHFAASLSQGAIGALYAAGAICLGLAATGAQRLAPLVALTLGAAALPVGIEVAAASNSAWGFAVGVAISAGGLGLLETGALGVLLAAVPEEKMVAALVLWSQVWAVGYAAGPAVAGTAAQQWGFSASGILPASLAAVVGLIAVNVARTHGATVTGRERHVPE